MNIFAQEPRVTYIPPSAGAVIHADIWLYRMSGAVRVLMCIAIMTGQLTRFSNLLLGTLPVFSYLGRDVRDRSCRPARCDEVRPLFGGGNSPGVIDAIAEAVGVPKEKRAYPDEHSTATKIVPAA